MQKGIFNEFNSILRHKDTLGYTGACSSLTRSLWTVESRIAEPKIYLLDFLF